MRRILFQNPGEGFFFFVVQHPRKGGYDIFANPGRGVG
jgi:hypothetical protein